MVPPTGALRVEMPEPLHDELTGLATRVLVLDRAENMLARARRRQEPAAALSIDIDDFGSVNATLGHEAGDRLLQAVAARLSTTLRDGDTIGRLGGTEFVALIEGTTADHRPDRAAQRILKALRAPFDLDDESASITITVSIGIASGDRTTASELLRDADAARHCAKAAGKNRSVTYQPHMQGASSQAQLHTELRIALERREFQLEYQPIFDLATRTIIGVEALLRWRHRDRGVVQPETFIPFLEESGLIVEVGRWVLFDACRQRAALRHVGYDVGMSVNVSARQLESDDVLDHLREALAQYEVDPARLTIEVAETTIIRDPSVGARRLQAMKDLGVRIAIDDLGAGSSASMDIRRFPIDVLKIDRALVNALVESVETSTFVGTVLDLGHRLGLETRAVGIEHDSQLEALVRLECDHGQGFILSKPVTVAKLRKLLSSRDAVRTP